jgi:hypothetical protein
MKKWTLLVAPAAVAASLALAAGPAVASPTAAAPKGACKYITTREAGTILGTPAGSGKSTTRTTGGVKNESCEWRAKKKGTGGIEGKALSLEIAVESGQGLVDTYQTQKAGEDPLDIEEVSGLGDDAYIEDLGVDLHVLTGERVLSVGMHNYRYPEPLTKEQIQQKEQDAAQMCWGA